MEMSALRTWNRIKKNMCYVQMIQMYQLTFLISKKPPSFGETLTSHECIILDFKDALSVLMLCPPVFIFTSSSSALLGHPCWCFINLTVATCHIQYTFQSLCKFVRSLGPWREVPLPWLAIPATSHEPPHTAQTPVTLNKSVEIRRGGHTE